MVSISKEHDKAGQKILLLNLHIVAKELKTNTVGIGPVKTVKAEP
jgi:hypothetical protein